MSPLHESIEDAIKNTHKQSNLYLVHSMHTNSIMLAWFLRYIHIGISKRYFYVSIPLVVGICSVMAGIFMMPNKFLETNIGRPNDLYVKILTCKTFAKHIKEHGSIGVARVSDDYFIVSIALQYMHLTDIPSFIPRFFSGNKEAFYTYPEFAEELDSTIGKPIQLTERKCGAIISLYSKEFDVIDHADITYETREYVGTSILGDKYTLEATSNFDNIVKPQLSHSFNDYFIIANSNVIGMRFRVKCPKCRYYGSMDKMGLSVFGELGYFSSEEYDNWSPENWEGYRNDSYTYGNTEIKTYLDSYKEYQVKPWPVKQAIPKHSESIEHNSGGGIVTVRGIWENINYPSKLKIAELYSGILIGLGLTLMVEAFIVFLHAVFTRQETSCD